MTEFFLRLLVLLRFLCFVALVYLGLHVLLSRLISKRDSKILWFFSVLTGPLLWPVRTWFLPTANETRVRLAALIFYGALWALILIATGLVVAALR